VRAVFPIVLQRLITLRAGEIGGGFERIDIIVACQTINHQTDQYQGDDPHEKHDVLLFYVSRISGVIKGFVKFGQRMGEGSLSGYSLAQIN
jgi:hypothetical protein